MNTNYSSSNIKRILESEGEKVSDIEIQEFMDAFNKINYVIREFSLVLCNNTLHDDKPFLKTLQNKINQNCGTNVSKKETFKIFQEFIKRKDFLKKIVCVDNNSKELNNYFHNLNQIGAGPPMEEPMTPEEIEKWRNFNPGFIQKFFGWTPDTKFFPTKILDIIALILDIIGFIPVEGEISDGIALLLNVIRGNWIDVIFNVIDLIPIVGSFIGVPGKYIHKFMKYEKKLKKIEEMAMEAKQLVNFGGPSGPPPNYGPPPPPPNYGPPPPPNYGPPPQAGY